MPLTSKVRNGHILPYVKGAYEVFCFRFLGIYFFSNIRAWYQEQKQNSKNWVKVLFHLLLQNWKVLEPKLFYIKLTRNRVGKKVNVEFNSDSWTCEPILFGRKDRALILTYLDSPMVKVFPGEFSFLSMSALFRGKQEFKVGPKVQILSPFCPCRNLKVLQTLFCLLKHYLWC